MWLSTNKGLYFFAVHLIFFSSLLCIESVLYSPACSVLENGFQSFDGSCNNENEEWGVVGQAFEFKGEAQVNSGVVDLLDDAFTLEPETPWTTALLDLVTKDIFIAKDKTVEGVVNAATPFLDLSNMYGTQSSIGEAGNFLAQAGLLRKLAFGSAEDYVGVIAALYLFSSEHKRLVKKLSVLNPSWGEVTVEHEARKLVIAQYQHVVVKELLPVLLGQPAVNFREIEYSSLADPALTPLEVVVGANVGVVLRPDLTQQEIVKEKSFEDKMKLMLGSGIQKFEAGVSEERIELVLDLVRTSRRLDVEPWKAVNDQCGLDNERFDVEDTVLGGLLEESENDGLLGPTMSCVFRKMIEKLILSDRFWYSNNRFTKEQLDSIEKVSLSSIICANTPSLGQIQPNAFLQPDDHTNAVLYCDKLPQLELDHWIQEDGNEFDVATLVRAIEKGEEYLRLLNELERELNKTYPSGRGYSKMPSQYARGLSNNSVIFEVVTRELLKNAHLRKKRDTDQMNFDKANEYVSKKLRKKRMSDGECTSELGTCDTSARYRSFNGRCNNLNYPENGAKDETQNRLLYPAFADGVSKPRTFGKNGRLLPNPRKITLDVHKDEDHLDPQFTLFVMQWGQFVDHDITLTPEATGLGNSKLQCHCNSVHPECFNIPYPEDDRSHGNTQCIEFARSLAAQTSLGTRENVNGITAYLDSSQIYGSEACEAANLRQDGGFLKTSQQDFRHKSLLPQFPKEADCRAQNGLCFYAGDARVNEQPGLTAIHTVLVREHNYIVTKLGEMNPHWDDERRFQEARRIVVAENQHITYNEFLPRLLGRHFIDVFSLDLLTSGYFNGYDQECDAGILNEFSTAAYRFGHSLIRNTFALFGPGRRGRSLDEVTLHNHFHNPDIMKNSDNMDQMLRGLLLTPMQENDANMVSELTDHLFEKSSDPFSGGDLAARNIQRGRDHGIPAYIHYREICKLEAVNSFDDLRDYMDDVTVGRLRGVYDDVADIDLFTGGLAERKIKGAMMGPTFACIIGLQFSHLRKCDRFWYENDLANIKFSSDQLQEIRGVTLSALICRNSENPYNEEVPKNGFDQVSSRSNQLVNCMTGGIKQINLEPWRENFQSTRQAQFQNPTAPLLNPTARLQNPTAQLRNPTARLQNPTARLQNPAAQSCQVEGISIPLFERARVSPCRECQCYRDGPNCQTVEVPNCVALVKFYGVTAVIRDKYCRSQCVIKKVNGNYIGLKVF